MKLLCTSKYANIRNFNPFYSPFRNKIVIVNVSSKINKDEHFVEKTYQFYNSLLTFLLDFCLSFYQLWKTLPQYIKKERKNAIKNESKLFWSLLCQKRKNSEPVLSDTPWDQLLCSLNIGYFQRFLHWDVRFIQDSGLFLVRFR